MQPSESPEHGPTSHNDPSAMPEFSDPPVAEVAADVQFAPLARLHGLNLAPLWDVWRQDLPQVEERPPLQPAIEGAPGGVMPFQIGIGTHPVLYWFTSESQTDLVQLQADRLSVNWRKVDADAKYPRYPYVRKAFARRFTELRDFLASSGIGLLEVTQAEVSYVNAIAVAREEHGDLGRVMRISPGFGSGYIGRPRAAQLNMIFDVPSLGVGPTRLHVQLWPGGNSTGESTLFLTMSVRGNPGGSDLATVQKFLDGAHDHVVRSFVELVREDLQVQWGKRG